MAKWADVNFDAAEWFIPKENVKDNVADLTVYLSDFALDQFRQLHVLTGDSKWCWPARNKEDSPIAYNAIAKQLGDRQSMCKKAKDGTPAQADEGPAPRRYLGAGRREEWRLTPHDLHHTRATMMQALGVTLDIIDRCQNHVLAGSKTKRHYMLHDYADEKRAAWTALGKRLTVVLV